MARRTLHSGLPVDPYAENPVYRMLVRRSDRQRRRILLFVPMIGLGIGFVIGYLNLQFSIPLELAGRMTLIFAGVLMAGHFPFHLMFAADAYDSNHRLKPFFADIILMGLRPGVIAIGIVGNVSRFYQSRGPLILAICLGGTLLAAYEWQVYEAQLVGAGRMAPGFNPALQAFNLIGLAATTYLLGLKKYADTVPILGAWLWYRWIRRSYETRLGIAGRWRFWLVIPGLSFAALLPLLGVFFAVLYHASLFGGRLLIRFDYGMSAWGAPVVMLLGGFVLGSLMGRGSRRFAPVFMRRLSEEIDRLFQLRTILIFERDWNWNQDH